jgi:hypothetical protein
MIWFFDVFFNTRDVIKWVISPAAHFTMASRLIPAHTDDHAQNHKVATFQAVRFTIAPRLSFYSKRPHRGQQYGQDRILILVREVQSYICGSAFPPAGERPCLRHSPFAWILLKSHFGASGITDITIITDVDIADITDITTSHTDSLTWSVSWGPDHGSRSA